MAGSDRTRPLLVDPTGPAVVLVAPQLGENIGATARAMLNCGLGDLRLVRPRDGWPNPKARAAAAGADSVLDDARVFSRTEDAIADLAEVFATTARPRDMVKPVWRPRAAAERIRALAATGAGRSGLLFGPERTGLDNDDVSLADAIVTVPLNPAYSSLNLAQAVLILAYEWAAAGSEVPDLQWVNGGAEIATKEELVGFFDHLEAELGNSGFFRVPEKVPSMKQNIRALFQRARPTSQEVRTLRGMIVALTGARKRKPPRDPRDV